MCYLLLFLLLNFPFLEVRFCGLILVYIGVYCWEFNAWIFLDQMNCWILILIYHLVCPTNNQGKSRFLVSFYEKGSFFCRIRKDFSRFFSQKMVGFFKISGRFWNFYTLNDWSKIKSHHIRSNIVTEGRRIIFGHPPKESYFG